MRIALVGHVEDDFVFRRVEHVMQGDGGLHHAEVRAEMAAVVAQPVQQCFAYFTAQQVEFLSGHFFTSSGELMFSNIITDNFVVLK